MQMTVCRLKLALAHLLLILSLFYAPLILGRTLPKNMIESLPSLLEKQHTAVNRNGRALIVLHDIDGDGRDDVFLLAAETDTREKADFLALSDVSRLYEEKPRPVEFALYVFLQTRDALELKHLIRLGPQLVLESILPQVIKVTQNDPFAIEASFHTDKGRLSEWILFSGETYSRFSVQERSDRLLEVDDIDHDGTVDIVVREQDYEVGLGYETYLSWYRWRDSGFVLHRSTNVLRNLISYLSDLMDLLVKEKWNEFLDQAILPEMRRELTRAGLSQSAQLRSIFFPARGVGTNKPIRRNADISHAVFPDIYENPFVLADSLGPYFPLTVRIETSAHTVHVYSGLLYMQKNPFEDIQFTFAPPFLP